MGYVRHRKPLLAMCIDAKVIGYIYFGYCDCANGCNELVIVPQLIKAGGQGEACSESESIRQRWVAGTREDLYILYGNLRKPSKWNALYLARMTRGQGIE